MSAEVPATDDTCEFCGRPMREHPDGGMVCYHTHEDLAFRQDRPDNPTTLTAFPRDADAATRQTTWISVAIEDAIALEDSL